MSDQATVMNALEDERRYIARELHDGVAQTTLQLGLQIGICRKLLERGNLEMLARELATLEERIQTAAGQVREMIGDLRPPLVEPDASLEAYLNHEIELHHERGGPPVSRRLTGLAQLSHLSLAQIITLTRIVQEALLNIRKHAGAKQAYLGLTAEKDGIHLTIADNGNGFDLAEIKKRPTDKGGAGLANLRARAEALGGSLLITTTGNGTKVVVKLPHQNL